MLKRLTNYMRALYPGLAINTTEEPRAQADVIATAKALGRAVFTWSVTEGMRQVLPEVKVLDDTQDLVAACRVREENAVYVLRDVQTWPFDREPVLARAVRDLLAWAPGAGTCVVFIGPSLTPHPTWEKMVVPMDYTLPTPEDLGKVATAIADSAGKKYTPKDSDGVTRALSGLTTPEAENALSLCMMEAGKFEPTVIYREKVQAVKRGGLLEVIDPDARGLAAIGGLEALKAWVLKRQRAYTPEAQKYGLPLPKGILLVGVPGTGKSLSAKCIGTAMGVPTIKLDVGALFNSLVGESEARTRQALALADSMAPCVLWTDEVDKGLAGANGSGNTGNEVTRRVFGTIINWMQDRKKPVFVVATANQVEGLPPEFLRKGRFDELFALDLPSATERAAILEIHLRLRKRNPEAFGALGPVVKATEGYTGSEIETVVTEAMFNAFDDGGREFTAQDLLVAAKAMTPLSVTAKETIDSIRQWARTRARFASAPEDTQPAQPEAGRRRLNMKEDK